MQEVRKLVFKTIKLSILSALGLIVASYFVFADSMPIIRGIVFGALLGVLNFYDLSLTLIKSSSMNSGKARNFVTAKYMFRYVVVGIVLLVSIKADYIHVLGTIAGLLLNKFVIIFTNLFNDKNFFMNIIKRKEEK
ncbi:MAG: ATP synthase subunit I [Bacillota bacterium]|nr:ATP synthase subunit I [Bacillota bacterium]